MRGKVHLESPVRWDIEIWARVLIMRIKCPKQCHDTQPEQHKPVTRIAEVEEECNSCNETCEDRCSNKETFHANSFCVNVRTDTSKAKKLTCFQK